MNQQHTKRTKIELYNDHFENAKRYQIPKAQLIIADIPYNIGKNAYGSRSDWYVGGGITRTENPIKPVSHFSIQMKTSIFITSFDFATGF